MGEINTDVLKKQNLIAYCLLAYLIHFDTVT